MTDLADPLPPEAAPEGPGAAPPVVRPSAPDEVWAAVRRDYLAGTPARACCPIHRVGLSTMRERAAREGWRRVDQPWAPKNRLDPDDEGVKLEVEVDGDLDRVELGELVWVAHRRMLRAVLRGDATEALRWRRVEQSLEAQKADLDRFIAQEESLRAYYGEPPGVDDLDGPDGPDRVFTRPDRPAPAPSDSPDAAP